MKTTFLLILTLGLPLPVFANTSFDECRLTSWDYLSPLAAESVDVVTKGREAYRSKCEVRIAELTQNVYVLENSEYSLQLMYARRDLSRAKAQCVSRIKKYECRIRQLSQ